MIGIWRKEWMEGCVGGGAAVVRGGGRESEGEVGGWRDKERQVREG